MSRGCRGIKMKSEALKKRIIQSVLSGMLVISFWMMASKAQAFNIGTFFKKIGYWHPITTTGALSVRLVHCGALVNSKIFIWGGGNLTATAAYNDGVLYNPATDAYSAVSATGAPAARIYPGCVSVGTKVVVWGGADISGPTLNTGGVYDSVANTWTATSVGANVPGARKNAAVVSTGTKVIVWGGRDSSNTGQNNGSIYDVASNTWTAMTTVGAPAARRNHVGYWNGSKFIVWGGNDASANLASGGIYDPVANSWTAMPTLNAPSARHYPFYVWTGTKLIVWGGSDLNYTTWYNTGAVYDSIANTWTTMTTVGAPSNRKAGDSGGVPNVANGGVWTGSQALIWGGSTGSPGTYYNDGALYDPVKDRWSPMPMARAPLARDTNIAIWTGSQFFIWGGYTGPGASTVTGALFY